MNTKTAQGQPDEAETAVEGLEPDPDETPTADAFDAATRNGRPNGQACPLVTPRGPTDVVLTVAGKRFPLALQKHGWEIPAALRRQSLAVLWSIISSGATNNLTKIRAIEALVRLDAQSLATERQDDWRSVQQSHSNRSNVRVLAELARSKAKTHKAKALPNKPPRKPKK